MKLFVLVGLFLGFASGFSTDAPSRRALLQNTVSSALAVAGTLFVSAIPANAALEIFNTPSGLKYAILKQPPELKKASVPAPGDIVAIEYTGYLSDGRIFDGTHSEGKKNALTFKLGADVVIEGLNEMVQNMGVGQKVQVIVPPKLAFGDKGLCLDDGECLIKPGATLVYDIYLKKSAIPPP